MGFFSNLLRTVGRVAGSFLGITPPVAPAAAAVAAPVIATAAARAAAIARGAGRVIVPAVGVGAGFALGERLLAPGVAGGAMAVSGGNGRTTRMTQVATIDNDTGTVLKIVTLKGAPFLMRNDVIIAKRVFRLSSKLAGRMPKRTVKQGLASQLTEKVQRNLIDSVAARATACPAPCP